MAGARDALEVALRYVEELGWPVFPCREKSCDGYKLKSPYIKTGFKAATRDKDLIRQWWQQYPCAMIGVPMGEPSGVMLVDLDIRADFDGVANLTQLSIENGFELPKTPMARTQSGSRHLYLRNPEIDSSLIRGKIADGVEIKKTGGYAIVPGSETADGRAYEWLLSPDECCFADLPDGLARLIVRAPNGSGASSRDGQRFDNGSLDRFEEPLNFIIPSDRETRVAVGMALHHESGGSEEGFALWTDWLRRAPQVLDPANQRRVWESFGNTTSPRTGDAIIALAKAGSWTPESTCKARTQQSSFNSDHTSAKRGPKPDGPITQNAVARDFVSTYRHAIRYDAHRGKWCVWNEQKGIWRVDETGIALELIRNFCAKADNTSRPKLGRSSEIRGVEQLSRVDQRITARSDDWDAHPFILATPREYVDLQSGNMIPPDPSLMLTQSTTVSCEAGTPTAWLKFLNEATGGDAECIEFIQRMLGYCISGSTKEHALFFIHGPGGTGKTTLLNVAKEILANYAVTAPMDAFTAGRGDRHPTELAMLQGRRLVTASETEQGRTWAEARIKQLTGGDPVAARYMRQDFFEYVPRFKLVIVGNHAPAIANCDDSMRRRFHVLPFLHQPEIVDMELPAKLVRKAGRILSWIVEGSIKWQRDGLASPPVVCAATDQYFESQDLFTEWMEQETFRDAGIRDTSKRLYGSYSKFMDDNGENPLAVRGFGDELRRRGFKRHTFREGGKPVKGWKGLKLLQ